MIVNAFDNPKLATKYEAEIGALMVNTAKGERRKPFDHRTPTKNPTQSAAQRKRDVAGPMVIECLLRHGPMTRDAVVRTMRNEGNVFPRDAIIHGLISGKQSGLLTVTGNSNATLWCIVNEAGARRFAAGMKPATRRRSEGDE